MEPARTGPTGPSDRKLGALEYVGALLGATRPHFFALPVGAALAGVAAVDRDVAPLRLLAVCLIAGGGWGSGQLLNDVLDREADAIDAPDRPAVRGMLPARMTVAIALLAGLGLLALLTQLTSAGLLLGGVSMALILTYNKCKGVPLLGNISHGALIATAALIGAAVALPDQDAVALVARSRDALLFVGLWAALYLQANYEKDARGDAAAGYTTLAHVLGTRGSAYFRATDALIVGTLWALHGPTPWHGAIPAAAALAISFSALAVARENTQAAALSGYRVAVHGGTIGMLGFGGAAVPLPVLMLLIVAAAALTEAAFRRSPNP